MDGDGRGEEVDGGVVEDEVLRVSIRQLPDEALGDGHAVGADDRGEARGVGKREFVVEGAGRMERAATGCRKKVLTSAKSSAQAVR